MNTGTQEREKFAMRVKHYIVIEAMEYFLVYLENEQPIIQINLETRHQHMHSHREHTGGAN